jgi:hypothetical protein
MTPPSGLRSTTTPAVALYEQLGFAEAYRYCHRVAPDSDPAERLL